MIARFSAEQLRKLADQLDALTDLVRAGANHIASGSVISVDGKRLAYLYWNDTRENYMAEVISFTPGESEPLVWHDENEAGVRDYAEPVNFAGPSVHVDQVPDVAGAMQRIKQSDASYQVGPVETHRCTLEAGHVQHRCDGSICEPPHEDNSRLCVTWR